MREGPIISYFVGHSTAHEWRERSIGEPTEAVSGKEKARPSLTVVIAGCIMVAALIGGATVAAIELAQAITG